MSFDVLFVQMKSVIRYDLLLIPSIPEKLQILQQAFNNISSVSTNFSGIYGDYNYVVFRHGKV